MTFDITAQPTPHPSDSLLYVRAWHLAQWSSLVQWSSGSGFRPETAGL